MVLNIRMVPLWNRPGYSECKRATPYGRPPSYTGLCNEKRRPQKQQKESLYPLSYPVFTAVTGAAAASSKGKGPGRTDLFLATPPNYPAWCSERTPSAGLSFFSRARWLT